ncbi:MAG: DUF2752 domain-containing protein [candidate division Zixibacteria bacterium]|nr:DUF2752 domain-containing protein [candidate division Zixibacteria bacterium]
MLSANDALGKKALAEKTIPGFRKFSPGLFFAGAIVILAVLPSDGVGLSSCPSQKLFGLSCPACGLTRSISSALHFDLARSVDYHPLGVVVLLFFGTLATIPERRFLKLQNKFTNDESFRIKSTGLFIGTFLVVWIIRMVYHIHLI